MGALFGGGPKSPPPPPPPPPAATPPMLASVSSGAGNQGASPLAPFGGTVTNEGGAGGLGNPGSGDTRRSLLG